MTYCSAFAAVAWQMFSNDVGLHGYQAHMESDSILSKQQPLLVLKCQSRFTRVRVTTTPNFTEIYSSQTLETFQNV